MKKEPKISIITIVKDGMPFLDDALKSFDLQSYKNKELIVVYTHSIDKTLRTLKSKKFISKIIIDNSSKNIYGSLNVGIRSAEGDIIGLLHSDDLFFNSEVLSSVAASYKNSEFEIGYGNIIISNRYDIDKPFRNWKSNHFKKESLKFGWMPPHTSVFISKKLKIFKYSTKYKISSDYEYLLKHLNLSKKIKYLNFYTTIMRHGGISNKYFYLKFFEDIKIIRKYFQFYIIVSLLKIIRKINQFVIFKQPLKNSNYLKFFVEKKYKFVRDANHLIESKNFVLSGFNLAFLAFVHNKINLNKKNLYLWPDGVLSKFILNKNKIPGRQILSKLKNNDNYKYVYLIASKNKKNLDYIKNKFPNKKIIFIKAPFGNSEQIFKKIYKKIVKIKLNSIILLGLPTPKQEILAAKISNILDEYKIICLGGAINYNSKDSKIPPKLFENYFESIWRLQNDTLRRLTRLLISSLIFLKRYLFKEYKNL